MTLIAYKYRLKPNQSQQVQFSEHFGHNRFVYNWALALKQRYYRRFAKTVSKRRIQDQLVKKKKQTRFLWLKNVNSQSLLFTLLQLDLAFGRFFKQQTQFPRFKSKYTSKRTFSCPQHVAVDFEENGVKLPKIGWVKAVLHREFEGKIKTTTVKQLPSGKYEVSILVDTLDVLPVKAVIEEDKTIGVDLGVKIFAYCSDHTVISNPKFLNKSLERLGAEQRILARKKKGGKQRATQVNRVARQYEKIKNQRKEFLHQITAMLAVKSHATSFVIEDLNVKSMLTTKQLSRLIADTGMGLFRSLLSYKCERSGKNLLIIDRYFPSSKTCSCCQHVKTELTLSDRVYTCNHCQLEIDRDYNAAVNIKNEGLKLELAGTVRTVKCSSNATPSQVGALAKGYIAKYIRSVEAPTRTVLTV